MKLIYLSAAKLSSFAIIIIVFTVLNISAQNCSYTWSTQNSGTTNILYTVKAVNELVCWTAGAGATVRRTTDGGVTWLNANPNPGVISGTIDNMEAIDANTAWVAVSSGLNTFMYKTTNGGSNWVKVYTRNGGYINGIRMINASNGIAIGDPIGNIWNLLLTTDGGTTWQPSPNTFSGQASETGNSNSFQVSLPNMWFGTSLTAIYRSTNGGTNWSLHQTPGAGIYVFSVHFNSTNIGLVAGTSMSKSVNGGFTFKSHPSMGAGNIDGIEGSGNDFWYIRGQSIYRSTNDGFNWSLVHTTSLTQKHMDFPDNLTGCQMGWSVGFGGTIYKMTGNPVGVQGNNNGVPLKYSLEQNYPNPFNPSTNIKFDIIKTGFVKLRVYDITGRDVEVIVNKVLNAGSYTALFSADMYASGIYFYELSTEDYKETKKMILLK
jgi:photosystem II stability/assembly factor-like uncharacterized protein